MFSFGKKSSSGESTWVTEASSSIEGVIDTVRDKAVVPLTTVARAFVYGLLALILGIASIVVLAIAIVRMLDVYLDHIPGISDGVWVADFVAGAIFVIVGLLLWARRSPKANHEG